MGRVLILPGNGCIGRIDQYCWYKWLKEKIIQCAEEEVILPGELPDQLFACASSWVNFLETSGVLVNSEELIIVGHSSGAVCAMRIAEKYPLRGIILVSPHHTTLGDRREEVLSHNFDVPFDFQRIMENCKSVHHLYGIDDHVVPLSVSIALRQRFEETFFAILKYYPHPCYRGHFVQLEEPLILDIVLRVIGGP
jgi:predicted alpha/beta hydrolase family esterase